MDLNIVSKEKNPFLKREEIKFEIANAVKTPTRKEVRAKLIALTNSKEEVLIVNKIDHKFGSHNIFGTARIYESKELMEKTEQKYIAVRNFGKKDKKETEVKEEPKEESTESKKEEVKTEDKKEEPKEPAKEEKKEPQKPPEEKKE